MDIFELEQSCHEQNPSWWWPLAMYSVFEQSFLLVNSILGNEMYHKNPYHMVCHRSLCSHLTLRIAGLRALPLGCASLSGAVFPHGRISRCRSHSIVTTRTTSNGLWRRILHIRVFMVDCYTPVRGMPLWGNQLQPEGRRPEGYSWFPRAASNPWARGMGCNNRIIIQLDQGI